jgi:selenocysteine-specific translation elongation factor
MNNSAILTPVQGPSTVACMIEKHNFQTDFINSLQCIKASEDTNLCTKFLLQIQKQREDSAMLLASSKQHKEITKTEKHNRINKTQEKDSREEQRPRQEEDQDMIQHEHPGLEEYSQW